MWGEEARGKVVVERERRKQEATKMRTGENRLFDPGKDGGKQARGKRLEQKGGNKCQVEGERWGTDPKGNKENSLSLAHLILKLFLTLTLIHIHIHINILNMNQTVEEIQL